MSKITFRADDDLVEQVERLDTSKSEVMREALRAYLEDESPIEEAVASGVARESDAREVNVNITVETADAGVTAQREAAPEAPRARQRRERECSQCGESLSDGHVFCPNCGEKTAHRFFCDCGDELRSDWAHCPSCGRRTPSADVLDR